MSVITLLSSFHDVDVVDPECKRMSLTFRSNGDETHSTGGPWPCCLYRSTSNLMMLTA